MPGKVGPDRFVFSSRRTCTDCTHTHSSPACPRSRCPGRVGLEQSSCFISGARTDAHTHTHTPARHQSITSILMPGGWHGQGSYFHLGRTQTRYAHTLLHTRTRHRIRTETRTLTQVHSAPAHPPLLLLYRESCGCRLYFRSCTHIHTHTHRHRHARPHCRCPLSLYREEVGASVRSGRLVPKSASSVMNVRSALQRSACDISDDSGKC
jgi:hypothetical protein